MFKGTGTMLLLLVCVVRGPFNGGYTSALRSWRRNKWFCSCVEDSLARLVHRSGGRSGSRSVRFSSCLTITMTGIVNLHFHVKE